MLCGLLCFEFACFNTWVTCLGVYVFCYWYLVGFGFVFDLLWFVLGCDFRAACFTWSCYVLCLLFWIVVFILIWFVLLCSFVDFVYCLFAGLWDVVFICDTSVLSVCFCFNGWFGFDLIFTVFYVCLDSFDILGIELLFCVGCFFYFFGLLICWVFGFVSLFCFCCLLFWVI